MPKQPCHTIEERTQRLREIEIIVSIFHIRPGHSSWSDPEDTFSTMTVKNKFLMGVSAFLKFFLGSSHCGSEITYLTSFHEDQVWSLASISGLRIQCCHELWCSFQTQLRSGVSWLWHRPMAVAPIQTLAWDFRMLHMQPLKKSKEKKKKKIFLVVLYCRSEIKVKTLATELGWLNEFGNRWMPGWQEPVAALNCQR